MNIINNLLFSKCFFIFCALYLTGCITTPTKDSGLNLDRAQLSDASLTCDEIKEEISKLETLEGEVNTVKEQSETATAVAAVATALAAVPIFGLLTTTATTMMGTTRASEDLIKIQNRREALAELYIKKGCGSREKGSAVKSRKIN